MKHVTITCLLTLCSMGFSGTATAQSTADKEFMGQLAALSLKGLTLTLKADEDGLSAQLPQYDQLLQTKGISPACMEAAQAKRKAAVANLAYLNADEGSQDEVKAFEALAQYGNVHDTKRLACLGNPAKS